MQSKLEQFQTSCFPSEVDGVLIQDSINRRYLLGLSSSAGTLVIFPQAAYFIIDSRYYEVAQKVVTFCEVILQDNLFEQIAQLLKQQNAKTVAVEDDRLTLSDFAELQKALPEATLTQGTSLCSKLNRMRIIKSQDEIEQMISAQRIAEKAFDEILNFIRVGRTEKEIAIQLEYCMKHAGAENLSFDTICVSGKNSSLPHGVPSDKKIEQGDFITMDYGALVNGYHSDMTRTVAVGYVSDEQQKVYQTVLNAQLSAIEAIRPDMRCKALDKIARDVIVAEGYGSCFGHGLGHGVGIEIHEQPWVNMRTDDLLEAGMVITIEPGVYLPQKFGVRIEDFGVVTANGFENFTKCEKKLICL